MSWVSNQSDDLPPPKQAENHAAQQNANVAADSPAEVPRQNDRAAKTNPATSQGSVSIEPTNPSSVQRWAPIAALIVIVAYFGSTFVLFGYAKTTMEEEAWLRIQWLFQGPEAIAFSAAGLLFGFLAQRRETDRAVQDKENEQRRRETAESKLAAVHELATRISPNTGRVTERSEVVSTREVLHSIAIVSRN